MRLFFGESSFKGYEVGEWWRDVGKGLRSSRNVAVPSTSQHFPNRFIELQLSPHHPWLYIKYFSNKSIIYMTGHPFKYHNLLGRKQNLLQIKQWYLHKRLLQDRSSPVGSSPPQWNQTPSNSGSGLSLLSCVICGGIQQHRSVATLRNNQPNIICMLVKMNEFAKKYMHACIEFYVRTLTKQSWKCILSNFAGNATLLATRFQVMFLMISSARGQLFL